MPAWGRFNPHPPIKADEWPTGKPQVGGRMCFNPHPPIKADEWQEAAAARETRTVSIRIRQLRRMNDYSQTPAYYPPSVSIRIRQLRRMNVEPMLIITRTEMFQSASAN